MKPTILQGHTRPVKSISFSSDCSKVFSASTDRNIISWNVEKKQKETTYVHSAAINYFTLSNCGKYLISGDNTATIYIWDIENVQILSSLEGNPSESVKSIFLNKTNEVLLIAFAGRGKTSPSRLKCFSFKMLLEEKLDQDKTGKEFDLNIEKNDGQIKENYSNQSIYNTKNSKNNLSFKKEKVSEPIKLGINEIKPLCEFNSLTSKYMKAVYIQKDKYILAAKENGFIELLNSVTGEVLIEKEVHKEAILDFDVCEKMRLILTSSMDGYSMLINLDNFEVLNKFHPDNPTRNLNACRIMLIDNPFKEKKINVDDLFNTMGNDLLEDKYFLLRKHDKLPIAVYSGGQDSKLVTTTHANEGGFEIVCSELITGMQLLNLPSHFGPVNVLGCIMGSSMLASGSEDSTVRLYDIFEYIKALDLDPKY